MHILLPQLALVKAKFSLLFVASLFILLLTAGGGGSISPERSPAPDTVFEDSDGDSAIGNDGSDTLDSNKNYLMFLAGDDGPSSDNGGVQNYYWVIRGLNSDTYTLVKYVVSDGVTTVSETSAFGGGCFHFAFIV